MTFSTLPIDLSAYSFDAIIFDCDGTLVNTAPMHFESFRLSLENQGAVLAKNWYKKRLSLTRRCLIESFAKQHSTYIDIETAIIESELHFLRLSNHIKAIPEVSEIAIKYWQIKPLAVASSGQRLSVLASLDAVSLRHKFNVIVSAEDVQNHKPSPEPYLTTAEKLNVSPKKCLVFEDTDDGLQSAQLAGAKAIDVRDFAKIYTSSRTV